MQEEEKTGGEKRDARGLVAGSEIPTPPGRREEESLQEPEKIPRTRGTNNRLMQKVTIAC